MPHTEDTIGESTMEQMLASLGDAPDVPEGVGFTIADVMRTRKLSHSAAGTIVRRNVAANKLREIGVRRNGKGGAPTRVYEFILPGASKLG